MKATLDHLVIAATSLEQGVSYVRETLNIEPSGGGRHDAQGTHNKLYRLGERQYLEVIAIDPEAAPPATPLWFALDDPAMQAALSRQPRLITWVARVEDAGALLEKSPIPLGTLRPMSRGDFRWAFTFTDDGHMPLDGLVPPLIEWQSEQHPTQVLADSGCSLVRLEGLHPQPQKVQEVLRALGLADELQVEEAATAQLRAVIKTASGNVVLT